MENYIVGFITVCISFVGCLISFKHCFFYDGAKDELAKRVKGVFFTDGMIYFITLCFGVWAFLNLSHDIALVMHWVRIPLLLANIYASWRLYKHYKEYK